jgi:hypothetical protein
MPKQGTPSIAQKTLATATPSPNGNKQPPEISISDPHTAQILNDLCKYFKRYMILSETFPAVISSWVMAAWVCNLWDRFPHIAITSPDGRCGKTRLLELLLQVCPRATLTTGISGPALYRKIQLYTPTLLLDEAQFLNRAGSEQAHILYEIFCGGVSKDAVISRCVGQDHEPTDFSIYCPKVICLIGKLHGVLPDRCLPISIRRKQRHEKVERCRMSIVEKEGKELAERLEEWATNETGGDGLKDIYNSLEMFNIENDRLAELLLPLQAVVTLCGNAKVQYPQYENLSSTLERYALDLEATNRQIDLQTVGVRLLNACRQIFQTRDTKKKGEEDRDFISTHELLQELISREEEPWAEFNNSGKPINAEKLSTLLREYEIEHSRGGKNRRRGYHRKDFLDAWNRYLPARSS